MSENIALTINGKSDDVVAGLSVAGLLEQLGLNPRQVAVEVNREVVPREAHASHRLNAGDAVEVMTLVGGG